MPKFNLLSLLLFITVCALVAIICVERLQDAPRPFTALKVSILYDGVSDSSARRPRITFTERRCPLKLQFTNIGTEPLTIWRPGCPPGDSAIALEFKLLDESNETGACTISHHYTGGMSRPKTVALQPGDSFVFDINLSCFWSLPFDVPDQESVDVHARFLYRSNWPDYGVDFPYYATEPPVIWTGETASAWQKITIKNSSGKNTQSLEAARSKTNILEPD